MHVNASHMNSMWLFCLPINLPHNQCVTSNLPIKFGDCTPTHTQWRCVQPPSLTASWPLMLRLTSAWCDFTLKSVTTWLMARLVIKYTMYMYSGSDSCHDCPNLPSPPFPLLWPPHPAAQTMPSTTSTSGTHVSLCLSWRSTVEPSVILGTSTTKNWFQRNLTTAMYNTKSFPIPIPL